jgi:virulence-associated protein VagC
MEQTKNNNWEEIFFSEQKVSEDFMQNIDDLPTQERNIF